MEKIKIIEVWGPYWPDREEGEFRYDFRVWKVTLSTGETIIVPAALDDNKYDVARVVLESCEARCEKENPQR